MTSFLASRASVYAYGYLLIAFTFFVPSGSDSQERSHCPNFSRYQSLEDAEIDQLDIDPALKRVGKIDKHIKPDELAQALKCAEEKGQVALAAALSGVDFVADPSLYQFAFSDFSYGRFYVSKPHYGDYLAEMPSRDMSVVKLTFDFDEEGNVAVGDVFSYRRGGTKVIFSEFRDGSMHQTDRCLQCHDTKLRDGLFFKSRFTGFKMNIDQK